MAENNKFSYYTYKVGRYDEDSMPTNKDFAPYEADNAEKLVWNVFVREWNNGLVVRNLFELNSTFLSQGVLGAKVRFPNNFTKFADHVRSWLSHEFWSRTEYETLISSWPPKSYYQEDLDKMQAELDKEKAYFKEMKYTYKASIDVVPEDAYKMDVYTQVMLNWDRFIEYLWNNRKLITKKKLGLN